MEVNITERGNVVMVEVRGVVDVDRTAELHDRLMERVRAGSGPVVVNMEDVDRLDNSGIATLVEAGSRAICNSRRPCRGCRQEETCHMLDQVGLDGAFDTFETVDEALDG